MCKKSLKIDEALGHKEGMASDYGNLGNVHRIRGDFDQAEEMYVKSLELFQQVGAEREIEQAEGLLAELRKRRQ